MKFIYKYVALLVLFLITIQVKAQTWEVSGTVMAFNTYPLKNITVKAKKSKEEALTDEKGRFTIKVKKNDQLIFDAKTFERYSYRVKKDDRSLKINLLYENKAKNKDIAIENGLIGREDLEYGIENLGDENNIFNNFSNIFDAIRYALPTVTFFDEGGQTKIMVRGPTTMTGSNAALTLVDGVVVDDISYLNPPDVVRIEQLSSSKAAIYGSRAVNGIIAITTK